MTSFLKLVADDLYKKLDGNFRDTTIIFPNKRASLFFNQYLWENNVQGHTMWAPEYTTISELFSSVSDYTLADPILLVVKLWEVYREKMHPAKSFDQLYSLIETMLSDFQDIDNNLVEPSKLFLNIADLKELTDFSFLEEEQRKAIEQFFGRFFSDGKQQNPKGTWSTPLKTQFLTLWNQLTSIYEAYQQSLLHTPDGEQPMVYEGMMKRHVIEALTSSDETVRIRTTERLTAQTYVMVGFNVLNKTELELFRHIKQERDAKFYWDYDLCYTRKNTTPSSSQSSKYEAGQFIMENIRLLGNEFEGRDLFRNMSQPKEITFIQSPTENAQTRYIHEWIQTHLHVGQQPKSPEESDSTQQSESLRESAIILCNEHLLQPVLHSIGPVSAINVTMGYPLSETPIFSLVQALLELQVHGHPQANTWRYRQVAAVLKHAFIQKLAGQECNAKLHEFSSHNVIFPRTEMFADNDITRRIFTPATGKGLTAYLSEIISMVGHSYQDTFGSQDFTLQIYKESIFEAYTVVNRLHTLQEEHASLAVSDETLMRLTMELMSQATIPFHGEPAIGLQVMGLLETRNLDFRHIIMLSVNEGQLPKSDKRASSITLLYNSSTDGGNKGEMSRFMLQTLAEKDLLFGPNQTIDLRAFNAASETIAPEPIRIRKDAEVMQRLHARFNSERILSPSALNTYMKCPLQFYFSYVAGLRPEDEVSDDVDKPLFDTIFHDTMCQLYAPYEGRPFSSSEARRLAADNALITQVLNNAFAVNLFHYPETDANGQRISYSTSNRLKLNGTQLINRHVIKEFVINQINADASMAEQLEEEGGYWQIISREKQYTAPYRDLLLGGIIDRLDLLSSPRGNRLRIVDYKTSSHTHSATTIEELFDPLKCSGNYHIMQTLYYCKVMTEPSNAPTDAAVVPALMYCAKDYKNNYSGIVKLSPSEGSRKEEIADYKAQYSQEYDTRLEETVEAIFSPYEEGNPQGEFTQCEDEQNCSFCDFLNICQRHPPKSF